MGTLWPDLRNSLLRVSGYLNAQLSSVAFSSSTIMLLLPNLRECDDHKLAKSLSDSEDVLAVKYEEWMRWRQEVCEHCERKEREQWE